MNTKLFNWNLIKYEIRNILGNVFTIVFGIGFPILFTAIMAPIFTTEVPEEFKSKVLTNIFIGSSCIIPLAVVFVGYTSAFSQEVEREIPLRLKLFGYKEKSLLAAKLWAELFLVTVAFIVYTIVNYITSDLMKPNLVPALVLLLSLYILTITFFVFAHGISLLLKKFTLVFPITMILYFAIMILSGLFGITPDKFPEGIKFIAYTIPTTYIANDFIDFWQGGSYNIAPFIQAMIFFMVISALTVILALYKNNRKTDAGL